MSIVSRIYSDFLMPDRLSEYETLLSTARVHGYKTTSVYNFALLATGKALAPDARYLILRHDVDTDVRTAEKIWNLERRSGYESSFFFRLSTVAPILMREMHFSGFEASYHYEELSTIAKQKGLENSEQIEAEMATIRNVFRANLSYLRTITGLPMRCVASHGDFVNRKIGISNAAILQDASFRLSVGIDFETYDEVILSGQVRRCVDAPYPFFWWQCDPYQAITSHHPIVHVLTHPRHWHSAPLSNLVDDVARFWQGAQYRLKTARVSHH